MASEAFAGVGTKFQRWDGAAWQDIAEVNSIDGPGMTKDVLEVTSLDTDAGYNEFITGFAEGGTLTLDMNFTRETYELMKEDFESDEVRSYRIQLPDYDSEPSTFTIEGLVIELPITMTADDKVTADVVIQITSQVILDDGISWRSYWATLISATVENAAPTHVVLTFPTAQTSLGAADFTIAGFTVSSASWTGAVLTLVVNRSVTFLDLTLTVTFVTTGQTATVTNNVAGGNLLAYYDHIQGAVATTLYDKSGNGKHGTLYATAPPSWTSLGTLSTGTEKIDLPALSTEVAPHTIIVGYKQTNKTDTMGQLLVANTAGNFMNYFFTTAPGIKRFSFGTSYTTFLNYVQSSITDWEILTFVINDPDIFVYKNGIRVFKGTAPYNIKINSAELSRIGFKGTNGVTAFYNKALNDAEVLNTYRSLAAKLRARGVTETNDAYNSVICDGDSITYGSYASDWYHSYPNQLRTVNPSISVLNLGVGGQRIDTMLTNAATVVDPLYMATGVNKSVVVCWGGSNDLAVFGRSDTDVYNDIVSYCSGRQTTGFKVIVLTILPRTDCTAGVETYRQSVNTSIRANWATFADALVDVAADTRLDDFNDATYFYTDKIHLTDAGYAVVASLINTAILALP